MSKINSFWTSKRKKILRSKLRRAAAASWCDNDAERYKDSFVLVKQSNLRRRKATVSFDVQMKKPRWQEEERVSVDTQGFLRERGRERKREKYLVILPAVVVKRLAEAVIIQWIMAETQIQPWRKKKNSSIYKHSKHNIGIASQWPSHYKMSFPLSALSWIRVPCFISQYWIKSKL